jgi:hypothetical protein
VFSNDADPVHVGPIRISQAASGHDYLTAARYNLTSAGNYKKFVLFFERFFSFEIVKDESTVLDTSQDARSGSYPFTYPTGRIPGTPGRDSDRFICDRITIC